MQPRDNKLGIPEEAVAWIAPLGIIMVMALLGIPFVRRAIEKGQQQAAEESQTPVAASTSNEVESAGTPNKNPNQSPSSVGSRLD